MLYFYRNRRMNAIVIGVSLVVLCVALWALLNPSFYARAVEAELFSEAFLPGTYAQDGISVLAAIFLIFVSYRQLTRPGLMFFSLLMGGLAFLFYAYGLYVISGLYTPAYPLYLLIFALCFYLLINGLSMVYQQLDRVPDVAVGLAKTTSVFFLLVVMLFIPLWLSQLIPAAFQFHKPEFYSVYLMDLVFVMPVLAWIAFLLWRAKPFGGFLAIVALVKVLSLCLSLVIGEGMLYSTTGQVVMLLLFAFLSLMSLVLLYLFLKEFRPAGRK